MEALVSEIKSDWQTWEAVVPGDLDRVRVDGGYLYRTTIGISDAVALAFVPDTDEYCKECRCRGGRHR